MLNRYTLKDGINTNLLVPLVGYFLYFILFIFAYFTSLQSLNVLGAITFTGIVLIGNYDKMFSIKTDKTVVSAIILICLSIIVYVSSQSTLNSDAITYLSKHIVTYFLYIILFSYAYSSITTNKLRSYFISIVIVLILLSLILGNTASSNEDLRLSGLFINPNNLALMALSLLFFVSEDVEFRRKVYIYCSIFLVLLLSSTSGASVAFLVALLSKYYEQVKGSWKLFLFVLLMLVIFIASSIPVIQDANMTTKVITQVQIVIENVYSFNSLKDINYENLYSQHGGTGLSGIWRLQHWASILEKFFEAPFLVILFGYGVGTTTQTFDLLPHNDYLRVVYEQGLFGFLLTGYFYVTIYKRTPNNYRYVLLAFAIFSFTENIIDNLLFMVLFVLFTATTQIAQSVDKNGITTS